MVDPATHQGPFSCDEAADLLGAPRDWFRRNANRFPHRRYGRRITFELADLDEIRAMHKRTPPENLPRLKPIPPRGRRR
ncbi:MAG TPA: hypothetical protein VGH11_04185 [Jatrophihabitans sp.]